MKDKKKKTTIESGHQEKIEEGLYISLMQSLNIYRLQGKKDLSTFFHK